MKNLFENRIATFLVSLLLAAVLWLLVRGELQVRKTIHVKVNYLKAEDLVLIGSRDQILEVDVRGPMALVSSLENEEPQIDIDFRNRTPGVIMQRNLDALVRRELPRRLEILKINPREIRFEIESVERKIVPIKLDLVGQPARGFQAGLIEMKPDRVTLVGATRVVGNMDSFSLGSIDLTGAQENVLIEREAKSTHADYWVEEKTVVRIQVQVQEQTIHKAFDIPVEVLHSNLSFSVVPSSIQIEVEGGLNLVEALTMGEFSAYFEARNLPAGSYRRPVAFRIPKGVKWANNSPRYFNIRLSREAISNP